MRAVSFAKLPCTFLTAAAVAVCLAGSLCDLPAAEEPPKRTAEGIQDNSFFIEEAYNQEPGVVQHILNIAHSVDRQGGDDESALSFVFTQEWPIFSQAHQFSYTLPYTFSENGDSQTGIEDISLNYRFQALQESGSKPAIAPRVSLVLPTADDSGAVGYEFNLPVSKIVSDRWTVHGNAGVTFLPDVDDHNLTSFNLGASAIYALSKNFNAMLEAIAEWEEEVNDGGGTSRPASVLVSPGFRYGFNHPGDAQTVIGLAVPIGVTSAAPDFGVFIYASFEHAFWRKKPNPGAK
jgi:hypothetical protein